MEVFVGAVAANREPAPPACLLSEAVEVMKVMEAVAGSEGKFRTLRP